MLHPVSGLGSWEIQDLFSKLNLPDLEQETEAQTLYILETLSSPKAVLWQSYLQIICFL